MQKIKQAWKQDVYMIIIWLLCNSADLFQLVMLYSTSAYASQVNYENDMRFFLDVRP